MCIVLYVIYGVNYWYAKTIRKRRDLFFHTTLLAAGFWFLCYWLIFIIFHGNFYLENKFLDNAFMWISIIFCQMLITGYFLVSREIF